MTGAARGIGFATAEKLAENGASVVLGDLNEPLVQEAAGRLKAKGYEALAVRMDVGRNDSIREAIAAAVKAFGGIDIVVNNAGILSALSIEEMTREEWDKVLNVNLGGTFFVIQAALPFSRRAGTRASSISPPSPAGTEASKAPCATPPPRAGSSP